MKSKISVVKPLFATVLFTVMVIEFLFLYLFYDMDFDFIIYQPEPGSQIHSSIPIYESPATLIVLKHECFFVRVEVCIHPTIDSKVTLSLPKKELLTSRVKRNMFSLLSFPENSLYMLITVNTTSLRINQ